MAKQEADCITLDLFHNLPKVGRPKTNPLSREQQARINKRNQLRRDRASGLKRVELKLHSEIIERLQQLADEYNLSRAQLIENVLNEYLEQQQK
ncbi:MULTISPECIES: LexA regulated protein [Testudinibacter]|uniref:LexA regulated protein n=1 Tax=Testudinibacter aquarius TaxID=1524974 RepID=A0A4R3Y567_9PAST|nr:MULTISPECIES: LexA regulated protein [Testudinibacter]TNH04419.1 LexA regulated protein [Pasteurellaceae bacterium Phil11]TNH05819.1 LexA regulated protein [Pasteurellaceae bacterium Phil31]KAE9527966.1 LexA family transcriptional regulator [Testudinibacter aquarius]TCV86571.1 ribbon-helix-helix CopG family protein [Testudinibacter aquarius]TNG93548.1 LexA regulated protein [Testudinibacter aquarius]